MPLTDFEIASDIAAGNLRIEPYSVDLLQPASIDVQLGPKLLIPKPELDHIDLGEQRDISGLYQDYDMRFEAGAGSISTKNGGYWLDPGQFILGATLQRVTIGGMLCGHLTGRSTLGRVGLLVHATAGFCDPGFSGCITLEIKNLSNSSILLRPGIRIGQLLVERLNGVPTRVYGADGLASGYTGSNDGPVAPNLNRKL